VVPTSVLGAGSNMRNASFSITTFEVLLRVGEGERDGDGDGSCDGATVCCTLIVAECSGFLVLSEVQAVIANEHTRMKAILRKYWDLICKEIHRLFSL
jgi:hypothetical protein